MNTARSNSILGPDVASRPEKEAITPIVPSDMPSSMPIPAFS